jgi:hypothetical protein
LHGFAMAYGGAGIAVSWPLARRLAPALDSCVLRYPHLYGSDGRIYACLAELGVELTHEPGFHQVPASCLYSAICCCSVIMECSTTLVSAVAVKINFFSVVWVRLHGSGLRSLWIVSGVF